MTNLHQRHFFLIKIRNSSSSVKGDEYKLKTQKAAEDKGFTDNKRNFMDTKETKSPQGWP